jgi:hypothetical protein
MLQSCPHMRWSTSACKMHPTAMSSQRRLGAKGTTTSYLAAGASGMLKGVHHMACAPMEREPSGDVLLIGDLQTQREALALGCAWTRMACGLVHAAKLPACICGVGGMMGVPGLCACKHVLLVVAGGCVYCGACLMLAKIACTLHGWRCGCTCHGRACWLQWLFRCG